MNKKRLLKLAELLEKDADSKKGIKFDMDDWGTVTNDAKPMSCGTSACAFGLAAISGKFKRTGLSYDVYEDGTITFMMNGALYDPLQAAAEVFDISHYEAEYLFAYPSGRGAKGERRVAKYIRKFVKRGGVDYNDDV